MSKLNVFLLFTAVFIGLGFSLSFEPNATEEKILVQAVEILSSKEYEGRRSGTEGNIKATNYLANEITRMGIPELEEFPHYKQDFTVFTKMLKVGDNKFSVEGLRNTIDFEPISFSLSGDLLKRELAFAGFGISIPETDSDLVYDDYKNLDVEDKIVVVLTGDPGIGNRNSLFRSPKYFSYRSVHYKLNNAIKHGAKGILFVQDPLSLEDPAKAPDLYFNAEEGGGNRFSIIAGQIKHTDLDELLFLHGKESTLLLQKKIAKKQSPISFDFIKFTGNLSVHLQKKTGRVSNIVAYLPGSDMNLKKEVIVLGAHFDHLGFGGASSMDPDHGPKIHFGADDNASGTALVLSLLKKYSKNPLKRSVMFVFFNAEESGLLGSHYFMETWKGYSKKLGKIVAMLNFDMVGRYDQQLAIMGLGSAFEWRNEINHVVTDIEHSSESGMLLNMKYQDSVVSSSDHASFINKSVPAIFFTTGAHIDYHRSTDTSEKIKYDELEKIKFLSDKIVQRLAEGSLLTFNPDILSSTDPGRPRGYGAQLGCVPQFGQDDSIKGVICTRVTPQTPAERAGLKGGDILVHIGDIEINSIYDLAFALKYYRAGDEVLVKWKRKGVPSLMSATLLLGNRN